MTNINVRIVSGWRLARRREIVSRAPEKIRSTATAEPGEELYEHLTQSRKSKSILTRNREQITCKTEKGGKLGLSTYPSLERFTGFKVFTGQLEILLKFVAQMVILLLVPRGEVDL